MEKFSQYRDRGTQIAPFLPIPSNASILQTAYGSILFLTRLLFFIPIVLSYFSLIHWLPIGSFLRKAWLWTILGICGVWWVDLQVEGVKRGTLAQDPRRLPSPRTVLASTFTSPIDALYLAAIFDPIFTLTYPSTPLVEHVSLPSFLLRSLSAPLMEAPSSATLHSISSLLNTFPHRTLILFPEATPTNGRGILRFTPVLYSVPSNVPIYPVSLKYTPGDVTTPLPWEWSVFFWRLLSGVTHCIRVRIAERIYNVEETPAEKVEMGRMDGVSEATAEAFARIGRVKRLNLGVKEKVAFVDAWEKNRKKGK